jgi:hypothetical protein
MPELSINADQMDLVTRHWSGKHGAVAADWLDFSGRWRTIDNSA